MWACVVVPDGKFHVCAMQERNIFSWSRATWKKEVILVSESKYAGRPLVSGMLAVSASTEDPVVYYSPMGKKTVRTAYLHPRVRLDDAKKETFKAGFKLKTENKKILVGLTADVVDPQKIYVLTVDGEVMACHVGGGNLVPVAGVEGVPFNASQERVKLHSTFHMDPRKKSCLVIVEAERSGITILESTTTGISIIDHLKIGTGGVVSGFGFIEKGSLAVATVSQARGNMGFFAWKVSACPDKSLVFHCCTAMPNSLWASLRSSEKESFDSFDDNGNNGLAGSVIHPKTGIIAFWTAAIENQSGCSHLRIPVIHVIDTEDLGAPKGHPLHSSPNFWIQGAEKSHDGVVSELYFPRYAYLSTRDAVLSLDISQGILSNTVRPNLVYKKQHQILARSLHSSKKGVWLLFSKLISGDHTGGFQFSAVLDREAALQPGSWWFPGRDGTFAGSRDELVVILTNSGKRMMIFDTLKLASNGLNGIIGMMSSPDEGVVTRVFKGPIARIPSPPKPKPEVADQSSDGETDEEEEEALQEWEAYEAKRHEIPKTILALTSTNKLYLMEVSQGSSMYHNATASRPKASYQLPQASAVIQLSWQSLMDPNEEFHSEMDGASTAAPCLLAVLLSDRVLFLNDKLDVVSSCLTPEDAGNVVSGLWIGPSLLVSTSTNQLIYVTFDGKINHGCSAMMGPPLSLLSATSDRIFYSYINSAGGIEASHRAWDPVPMMLLGWAEASFNQILPGGYNRSKKALISLLSSYGATKIPLCSLEGMSKCGFPDLAAAAASCSELTSMSEARKCIFQASAGDWDPIVTLLITEYEESEFYPDHPEQFSPLYHKMVVLARACQLHGRFKHARILLESAGAWRELLSLCVFQGDFEGLQRYASHGGRQAELLASHLLAVNEDAFRRSVSSNEPKFHGRPFTDNYSLKEDIQPDDVIDSPTDVLSDSEFPRPLEVAPADRLPCMQATLQLHEDSILTGKINIENSSNEDEEDDDHYDPIGRIDRSKLESYVGIAGAHVKPGCVISGDGDVEELQELEVDDMDDIDFDQEDSVLGAVQRVITASPGSDTATETSKSESVGVREVSKSVKEQEEARAAFFASKKLIDDEFYSSDEDSSVMAGDTAASFAATTTSKLIFKIKSKEEMEIERYSSESLKYDVQNLKLEESVTKSSFKQLSLTRSDASQLNEDMLSTLNAQAKEVKSNTKSNHASSTSNLATTSTLAKESGALPEDMFSPMKPQEPAQVATSDLLAGWNEFEALFTSPETSKNQNFTMEENESSSQDIAFIPTDLEGPSPTLVPASVVDIHSGAQKMFTSSSWQKAAREFGRAFSTGTSDEPNNEGFRRRCASEYAASLLMQRAAKAKSLLGARLARHAAGLDLDLNMQLVTHVRAAELNIKAGNKEWSAELLSTILLEVGGEDPTNLAVDISRIQKLLTSCDSNPSNKSVPSDEDVNSTRMIIEVSQTLQEIDSIVAELSS